MSEALYGLLPVWGGWLLFVATFLSCLALPVPSSLLMLGAGAFAASGDLGLAGAPLRRAERVLARHGAAAVFLTRWLFSPLGPYVNFLGGAAGMRWTTFSLGSVTGETVWVTAYVGLGFGFASHVNVVAELTADVVGMLAAAAVSVILGWSLFRRRRS
jgi:membrane protein DedA with SNARE-associated domain